MDCAYHEHRPQTDAGRLAWGLFIDNAWRVQVAGMGYVAGVDTSRAQSRLEKLGLSTETAEDLLAACEQGFVAAVNEKAGEADGQEP